MATLNQGVDSRISDDVRRQEFPSRLAIEKGMQLDEALVVSQLSGGNGIFVEQSDGVEYVYNSETDEWNEVLYKPSIGNLFIRRFNNKYPLSATDGSAIIDISQWERMCKLYGNPLERENINSDKSVLRTAELYINGVAYHNWEHWEYRRGEIYWYGMFPLEEDDDIYLKV